MENYFKTQPEETFLLGSVSKSTICVPFENHILCYPKSFGGIRNLQSRR